MPLLKKCLNACPLLEMTGAIRMRDSDLHNPAFLFRKFSVQTVSVACEAVIQLASIMIMSRLLSKTDFGLFAVASGIRTLALVLSEAGIASAVVHYRDISRTFVSTAFWCSLSLGTLVSVIVYILAEQAAMFNTEPAVEYIVRAISITFLLNGLSAVPRAILQRDLRLVQLMVTNVSSSALSHIGIGVCLALWGYGCWAMVYAMIGNSVLRTILLFLFSRFQPQFLFSCRDLTHILRFSAGLTLASLLNALSANTDKLLLGRFLGIGLLGAFSRVTELIAMLIRYIFLVMDTVLFPAFSRIQQNKPMISHLYKTTLDGTLIAATIAMLYLNLASAYIIRIVLGETWSYLDSTLKILGVLTIFNLVASVSSLVLRSLGSVYTIAMIRMAACLFSVAAIILGARYGVNGVAWGLALSTCLVSLLMSLAACRIIGLNPYFLFSTVLRAAAIAAIFHGATSGSEALLSRLDRGGAWIVVPIQVMTSTLALAGLYLYRPHLFGAAIKTSLSLSFSVLRRFSSPSALRAH